MIIEYTLRTLKLLPLRFAFSSLPLFRRLFSLRFCASRALSTTHRFAIVSQHLFRFLSPFLCTQHDALHAASEWSGQLPRNRNVLACECVCFRFLFKFICWINTSQHGHGFHRVCTETPAVRLNYSSENLGEEKETKTEEKNECEIEAQARREISSEGRMCRNPFSRLWDFR